MIKDILVHLSTNPEHHVARDYAISVAETFEARLNGIAFAYEPFIPGLMLNDSVSDLVASYREENCKAAQAAKSKFDEVVSRVRIPGGSRVVKAAAAEAADSFARTARHHDLVVIGQARPECEVPEELIVNAALFESGRPVLIVPYIHNAGLKLDRVMVCWDGSRMAARAVADAMPLLKRAGAIDVVTVETKERHNTLAGADIAEHLAHHRLKVELKPLVAPDIDVPNAILSFAADTDADLIVMGGYGHSRLREFILGGATRGMLESMTVPTLMAH